MENDSGGSLDDLETEEAAREIDGEGTGHGGTGGAYVASITTCLGKTVTYGIVI